MEAGSRATRLDSLTGLRWFAALAVFVLHAYEVLGFPPDVTDGAWQITGMGHLGVSFFFVLSGFVLTWSWRPGLSWSQFMRRRAARIVPLAWLATLLWFVYIVFFDPTSVQSRLRGAAVSLTFLQAWIPKDRYFFGGNAVEWSLSVEFFFYALFPLMIALLWRWKRRAVVVAGAVTAVIGVALVVGLQFLPNDGWSTYIFPPVRLPEFFMGVCAALLVRAGVPRIPLAPAIIAALVVWQVAPILPGTLGFGPAVSLPFVVLIVAAAQAELAGRAAPLRHPWLVRLGEWSFAFYLVHTIVIASVSAWIPGTPVVRWSLALALAIALSALLHHGVEVPLERRLSGRRRRGVGRGAATGSTVRPPAVTDGQPDVERRGSTSS